MNNKLSLSATRYALLIGNNEVIRKEMNRDRDRNFWLHKIKEHILLATFVFYPADR